MNIKNKVAILEETTGFHKAKTMQGFIYDNKQCSDKLISPLEPRVRAYKKELS